MNIYRSGATPWFCCYLAFASGCLWPSVVTRGDAATAVCSGWFGGSLALTSTAEPWGTFTTDLASHFQCCSGRPLRSVSAVPSSFHITSPRTHLSLSLLPSPALPCSPYLSQSAFVSKGGEQGKKKKKTEEKRRKQVKPFPSPLPLLPLLCRYQCRAR